MNKHKPKPDPIRRVLLAMIPDNIRESMEKGPPEVFAGVPTFTKSEFAQARRDTTRISKLYDEHGRFVKGFVLSRQQFLTEVLRTDTTASLGDNAT